MPGYLDEYGAGEDRREKLIYRSIAAAIVVIIVGLLGYYVLKNHHQEGLVKHFLSLVSQHRYEEAYRAWGCADPKTCQGYAYDKFLEDWGPQSSGAAGPWRIADSEACGNGVILTLESREDRLFVEKNSDRLSFSPFPVCPGKSPFAIMLHRTVGKLRKLFF